MVYLNSSGSLIVLDNSTRLWTRKPLVVEGSLAPTGITQMKIFDMDGDKKDDIVYISESGELAILYGTSTLGVFTKKVVDNSF